MVCLPGLDRKSYESRIACGGELPEIACPAPACLGERLRGHGGYHRYLDAQLSFIRRLRCPRCGVTHALLPEDVCAYRDLSLEVVEKSWRPPARPLPLVQPGTPEDEAGVRRARGWLRQIRAAWSSQVEALLPPAPGAWWERARALLGAAPGMLVRLRHWLWSIWRCFFGGLTGLYRLGRPRLCFRRDST